jgi:parallel beta-helix repeat protein
MWLRVRAVGAGLIGLFIVVQMGAFPAAAGIASAYADGSGAGFTPFPATRLLDTRTGVGHLGSVGARQTLRLSMAGRDGVPQTGVAAVALNVAVTGPQAPGYVTVYPDAPGRPGTSNLNFVSGQTVANLVVVPMGADGDVDFYNSSAGSVQLIADLSGWFTAGASGGGSFTPFPPTRLLDTRVGQGQLGPVGAGQTLTLSVAGPGGAPAAGVGAVLLNVTVTGPKMPGYLTVYPNGTNRPKASSLNFAPGQTAANLVVVPVGVGGKIDLYNGSAGSVQLVGDLSGWFAAGAAGPGGLAGLTATRLLDTRVGVGHVGAAAAGQTLSLSVSGLGGMPQTGVAAVALNVTVTGPGAPGYLSIYPDAPNRPPTSNLDFASGQTTANMVVVPVGVDGKIDFYNGSAGSVQMIADLLGWFVSAPGASSGAPASPPVTWCETGLPNGPASAPAGAVVVPAGNNSGLLASGALPNNTTYWFAPGTHTIGTSQFSQIQPGNGDKFIGGPGAILDGQNQNQYAFEGTYNDTSDQNVTIEYLTVQHFNSGVGAGAVNGAGNNGWTEEYNLIQSNTGAGIMLGGDNTVANNCLTNNGEYGFNGYSFVDETYEHNLTGGAANITFTGNEVSKNNTNDTTAGIEGGGKFWSDQNVTVTGNYVHDNIDSPGLWMDTNNDGFVVEDNYISNNGGQAIFYEISYNALIENNTIVDNTWPVGAGNAGFGDGTIYISESGGDSRVANSFGISTITISGNVLTDNWGGVQLYDNGDRLCSSNDSSDCTLVNPAVYTPSSCAANDTASAKPTNNPDYFDNCRWWTQNVTVTGNTFNLTPANIPGCAPQATTTCGFTSEFASYGNTAPYSAYLLPNAISNLRHNSFSNNSYHGPWGFIGFVQGEQVSQSQWTHGFVDDNGSGYNFPAQDVGSTFTS